MTKAHIVIGSPRPNSRTVVPGSNASDSSTCRIRISGSSRSRSAFFLTPDSTIENFRRTPSPPQTWRAMRRARGANVTDNQQQPTDGVVRQPLDKPKGMPAQKLKAPGEPARKPTKS